ncbi:MAG TPA: type II toxin-antitoxin system RelE/ParE family toxin [Planctomycetota bacterium]|nr:type II toxin-antitoxin system RelE/ParE family toxin [Planctomycetota bacterium]
MAEIDSHDSLPIRWSPSAADDLISICRHIEKDSRYYAANFAKNIIVRIEVLSAFPDAGRIVPEYDNHNIREIIYHNYRIVYRRKKGMIEIIRITHGARLLCR